jgi:hypothetical protein
MENNNEKEVVTDQKENTPPEFWFDPVEHKYYVKGIHYVSVTQWIQSKFKKFNEKKQSFASAKTLIAKRKAEDVEDEGEVETEENEKEEEKVNQTSSYIKERWKKSREKGLSVHDKIDRFLRGEEGVESQVTEQIEDFMKKFEVEVFCSEVRMFDEELQMAGTVDAVFYDRVRDQYILVDWKNVKKMHYRGSKKSSKPPFEDLADCNYTKYCIQLNLYKYLLKKKKDIEMSKCYIVITDMFHTKPEIVNVNELDIEKIVEFRKKEVQSAL